MSDDTVRYHTVRKLKKTSHKKKAIKGRQKTLVISDLHAPFHREEAIIEIIMKHRHEVSTIIFAGDIIDCEAVSKFSKEDRKTLAEEMIVTWELLRRIDVLTPNVEKIIIWGNHEYRYVNYLANMKSELNSLHSNNIIKEIVKGFSHYDRESDTEIEYTDLSANYKVVNKWFFQFGDAIFAHPKNFSRVPLRTAVNAVTYFIARRFKFNVLFIGHTHKWGSATKFDKWYGELGCLCLEMEYADTGNTNYTPQEYGYLLLTQYDGITDVNESRLYRLDLEGGEDIGEEA